MEARIQNKVVFLTGASGGIGRACAEMFADEEVRLVLHGHDHFDEVEALADELPIETVAVQGDISDEADVERIFAEAVEAFGQIDVVVANAGIWPPDPTPLHAMSLEQWERTITTNLTGTFLCAREYFRHLEKTRPDSASLVLVGSTAALFGEADHADYAASKAGLTYGLTRTLKNEIVALVPTGRVNAVCPGWTLTRLTEEAMRDHDLVVPTLQTRPLKKIARARDVASAVVFLVSDALAGHVTGEVLTVAGGMEGRLLHPAEDIDPSQA